MIMELNKIIQGDVLEVLKTLPSESIDCCITSPPYWGLRDYGTAKWEGGNPECKHNPQKPDGGQRAERTLPLSRGGIFKTICELCGAIRIDNQIGLEPTPEEFVAKMVSVFAEVKRVLKKEGTLWLNLGDSYVGGGRGGLEGCGKGSFEESRYQKGQRIGQPTGKIEGLKPKDLCGIPWRVAFALQADGWYLRQDIIWAKPNPMPESVTDRCTKSHEYVFLMSKSPHYFYDSEAIKEEAKGDSGFSKQRLNGKNTWDYGRNGFNKVRIGGMSGKETFEETGSRNRRSVWTITTKPFMEAHFATFPEDLIEPMIKAGSSEKGVCLDCGKALVVVVEKTKYQPPEAEEGERFVDESRGDKNRKLSGADYNKQVKSKILGWKPQCSCGSQPVPAIVLDPFMGAGTTAVVAKKLGRNYIGIELNTKYIEIAKKRINRVPIRLDRLKLNQPF